MKLSCLPVSYFAQIINGQMTIGQWAHEGAALGLDAIDISILFVKELTPSYLSSFRQQVEDAGIGLTMVCMYTDFTHPDAGERQRQIEQAAQQIEAAARLGARYCRITSGQGHPGIAREQGIAWSIDGMLQTLAVGKANHIEPIFENHARPGVWQYPDFCFPTDIFLDLMRRTEETGLGVNWDTANQLAYGDDPLPVLKQVVKRVVTVHAAETSTRGTLTHVLPGTGLVPFREQFRILHESGWDNWICIEENSKLGHEGVARSVQFVRKTWDAALRSS
jgi:sugar phosphate isomerase/epimerase